MNNHKSRRKDEDLGGFSAWEFFFSSDNLTSYRKKGERIRSVALFLLPYYKFLCEQPWQFYENEDVENLRMLTEIKEDTRRFPVQERGKKNGRGGD